MINIDANLFESHQRPHANTAHHKHVHIVTRQQVYRHHTPALDMLLVLQGCDFFYFPVFNIDECKNVTVTEMT